MVKFIEYGDIFALDGVNSFAHGCNCAGAMGRGIAVQFKEKFPQMYHEYKEMCRNGLFRPGDVFDYNFGIGYVYNLGTQESWRTRAKIEYIEEALTRMIELAKLAGVTDIAMPAIGAGLGGLDWGRVKEVIETVADKSRSVTLHVVEKYRPKA